MPRFFIKKSDIFQDFINVTGDDVSHIKKVLRSVPGDELTLCDGAGTDYLVRIDSLNPDHIKTRIISSRSSVTEPPVDIILFQGLPKSDKMDFIIQKSVELGVKKVFPVFTERTIVKIDSNRDIENKVSRWNKICAEASKQCNRGAIPVVERPVKYEKALELAGGLQLALVPYENETQQGLKACLRGRNVKTAGIMIGPEGGFTESEIDLAVKHGVKPVTLGPRILRTETAGIAVLSMIMYEIGDVG